MEGLFLRRFKAVVAAIRDGCHFPVDAGFEPGFKKETNSELRTLFWNVHTSCIKFVNMV